MSAERGTIVQTEFPAYHPNVYETSQGTLYLKEPGVVMIAAPAVNISGLKGMLAGFPKEYEFENYLSDETVLSPGEQLTKVAGQACYASFGPKRTYNIDTQRYIDNLISSGHGSVLEHANFSIFMYGVSRSLTHELVRHRAGAAYSQLSQRYVSGRILRFVERPEYQNDQELHAEFENRIDRVRSAYENTANKLIAKQQAGETILSAEAKTDLRKKVQQVARSLLPNETETFLVMTANVRAWRHIISMRANEHAETEIRNWAFKTYELLNSAAPMLFADYEVVEFPDGTKGVHTEYPKV